MLFYFAALIIRVTLTHFLMKYYRCETCAVHGAIYFRHQVKYVNQALCLHSSTDCVYLCLDAGAEFSMPNQIDSEMQAKRENEALHFQRVPQELPSLPPARPAPVLYILYIGLSSGIQGLV